MPADKDVSFHVKGLASSLVCALRVANKALCEDGVLVVAQIRPMLRNNFCCHFLISLVSPVAIDKS